MSIKKNAPSVKDNDGVYVYIGPSIRGVIQNGSIFRGSRKSILSKLADVAEKHPKVTRLLVKDTDVAEAREKIKKGGNGLSNAYNSLISDN